MAKHITFAHSKGGTGKTTSCLNIAGWLVRMGQRVLVVDLDPRGDATAGLGIDKNSTEGSTYDVLCGGRKIEETIVDTPSGVYLAPASLDLHAAEARMAGSRYNPRTLKEQLLNIEQHVDYVLVDVPAGSVHLVTSGIIASGNLIVPSDHGVFAYEALESLKALVMDIRRAFGIEVSIEMVLLREPPVAVFSRPLAKGMRRMMVGFLEANGLQGVDVYTIPFSHGIDKAQTMGMPISHTAPRSAVGRAYRNVTRRLLIRDLDQAEGSRPERTRLVRVSSDLHETVVNP